MPILHAFLQVEKLIAEVSSMEEGAAGRPESAGGSPLEARVRIFERLASEVARLNFYTARGKASSFPMACPAPESSRFLAGVETGNLISAYSWSDMLCYVQELQFVQQLEPRMKAGAGRLQELLAQGLAEALQGGIAPARMHCLQAFAAIGDAEGAEKVEGLSVAHLFWMSYLCMYVCTPCFVLGKSALQVTSLLKSRLYALP